MDTFQRICLVHYHEIGLKGYNRKSFEMRLLKNIEYLTSSYPIVTIRRISGRLCVFIKEGTSLELSLEVASLIKTIPGVARVSCGFKCERDLNEMYQAAFEALSEAGNFISFKVSARRNHTDFETNSMEMNQLVGAYLCEKFPDHPVKMKNPDVTVSVEVVQNASYIYAYSMKGVGGLPVGSSGKMISLLSSGIDSPVALWKMARRGAQCSALHFSGRPQTADTSEYLVADIAEVLENSGCIEGYYVVPFGDYQRQISLDAPPELRVILYRRLMLRVANALADSIGAKALVTGESLGQVASQTLENLIATDDAVDIPVLRPLIGTDKQEIIDNAIELGTFDISSQEAPDCCTLFMPRNPETHAKLDKVRDAESKLPLDKWIPEIVGSIEYHPCSWPMRKKPRKTESE